MAASPFKPFVQQDFEGGIAIDVKVGIKNSSAYLQSFDFRSSPSQLTPNRAPTREDNGVVTDLIQNEVMTKDGTIFAIGSKGNFYKRTTAGVWSVEANLSPGFFGLDYRQDADAIYITHGTTASLYTGISTANPIMNPSYYNISQVTTDNSAAEGFNVNPNDFSTVGGATTYTLPTTINEGPTNLRYFQSDIEPINKISIFFQGAAPAGNVTLTLHDGLNNVLATSTILAANIKPNTWNDFVFATQVRIYILPNARTYHFHLTDSVGSDAFVSCDTQQDLSTADMQLWADRFVLTKNGMHPMQRFLQYEMMGNGNYLSIWEPISDPPTNAEWQRHALVFPQEYEVCGLAQNNEFILIAAEKNTSTSQTPQAGVLFFWDGISSTYNYDVPIPEGSPYGLFTYKNVAYYYAGGSWWSISSPTTEPVKLRNFPTASSGVAANVPITVYPYAGTVRNGVALMAWPSKTTNTNVKFGVYSWGQTDTNFPNSFGYDYVISTGSQNYSVSNNLQIGMVQAFGDILHISWQDTLNGGYGIDVVTSASNFAPTAIWQGLIIDNNYAAKQKTGNYVECYYSIPAGVTITLGYSINRGAFVQSQAYSTTNLWEGRIGYAKFNISDSGGGRFYEIQPQVTMNTSQGVTITPAIYMNSLMYDDGSGEQFQ